MARAAAQGRRAGGSGPAGPGQPAGPAGGARPGGFAGKVTLTIPAATLLEQAERPGEIPGIGPIDPALARDLADAAARNPKTTWCVTVTDQDGHAVGHGCARPEPKNRAGPGPTGTGGTGNRDGPGFAFTPAGPDGPPGGYGTWRLTTPGDGPDLIITLDPVTTENCDHRFETRGHDPGVKLRHLSQIRHATCTGPVCRRPASQSDFEHNTPYEAGGRTCLCNTRPEVPPRPPAQAAPPLARRPAPRRHLQMDHPLRADLRPPNPPATPSNLPPPARAGHVSHPRGLSPRAPGPGRPAPPRIGHR